jgi:hypothetical protein
MKKLLALAVVAALMMVVGCSKQSPMSSSTPSAIESSSEEMGRRGGIANATATYKVVIENLTPNNGGGASQPFSPLVIATHNPKFHIFRDGKMASYELGRIAEDAQSTGLLNMLGSAPRVYDYAMGDGVVLPGSSTELMVEARVGFRQLSLVGMLVNTNDGFVGADGLRLPKFGSEMHYLYAYDAGTEKNTEMTDHIPGPCCGNPGVRVPENKRISTHDGIEGVGDLDPAVWGWRGPAAKVTITLVSINS